LLVDVLKSKHVSDRYKALLAEAENRPDVEDVLICAFSLEVMGFAPKISHIQELLANRVRWPRLRTQPELRSIVDFGSQIVRARSSVLASHLLHDVFSAKSIVKTLTGMAHEADARRGARDYYQILTSLMRYRFVSAILPETNRLEATINFYEGVKNLSATKRNPQFWLQYAIACLAFGKLERAELYFDAAYSLTFDGYDTYQIDNHYSRLLLEKALIAPSAGDAVLLVDKAKKIILQQMSTEIRYYPYRVARSLFRCFERFNTSWTPEQKAYFMRIFQEIKRRCESIKGDLRNNRYVTECLEKANEALQF
jgi:tetratricopeptide (TPR) repeat protein